MSNDVHSLQGRWHRVMPAATRWAGRVAREAVTAPEGHCGHRHSRKRPAATARYSRTTSPARLIEPSGSTVEPPLRPPLGVPDRRQGSPTGQPHSGDRAPTAPSGPLRAVQRCWRSVMASRARRGTTQRTARAMALLAASRHRGADRPAERATAPLAGVGASRATAGTTQRAAALTALLRGSVKVAARARVRVGRSRGRSGLRGLLGLAAARLARAGRRGPAGAVRGRGAVLGVNAAA